MRSSYVILVTSRVICFLSILVISFVRETGAQWVQTNGPLGGIVEAIAFSGPQVLAGTKDGGTFLSLNNGSEWSRASQGLSIASISAATVIGGKFFVQGADGSLFHLPSTDGTWSEIDTTGSSIDLATVVSDGKVAYALNRAGQLFLSLDQGLHWIPSKSRPSNRRLTSIGNHAGFLFASNDSSEIYRTADSGSTWQKITYVRPGAKIRGFASTGPDLFVASDGLNLDRTSDSGKTFSFLSGINTGFQGGFLFVKAMGQNLYAVRMGQDGMARSSDSGMTWKSIGSSIQNAFVTSFDGRNDTLFIGTLGGGVLRSTDSGNTWATVNTGLVASTVRYMATSGPILFAGAETGSLFRSTTQGGAWTRVEMLAYEGDFRLADCGTALCAATTFNMLRSTDKGLTWSLSTKGLENRALLSMTRLGDITYVGSKGGFLHYSEDGTIWTWVLNTKADADANAAVTVDGTILIGTGGDGVQRSPNGVDWSLSNAGLENDTIISMFAAGTTVIARTPFGLRKSQNKGSLWSPADRGVERVRILSMAATDSLIFIGSTKGALYISRDFGESWQLVPGSLESLEIQSLAHDGTYLYAGTAGRGIWKREIGKLIPSRTREFDESGIGSDVRLLPGRKSIELTLSARADVVSEGFDLGGRLLFRSAVASMEPGRHLLTMEFPASKGIVIYRLWLGKVSRDFRIISVQ